MKLKKIIFICASLAFILCVGLEKNVDADSSNMSISNSNYYITGDSKREAIKVSRSTFNESKSAVLVGRNSIPDALSSAALAGKLNAPILLSEGDYLDGELLDELNRLGVRDIYITSGIRVIQKNVRDELLRNGFNITDISGYDRYATSEKIASIVGNKSVIIVNGKNYYDVQSISQVSYAKKIPIVLVKRNTITSGVRNIIHQSDRSYIIGGENTISKGIQKDITKYTEVIRIGGVDRYSTSEKIIAMFYKDAKKTIETTSEKFMSGIVYSPFCAINNMPLKLVKN